MKTILTLLAAVALSAAFAAPASAASPTFDIDRAGFDDGDVEGDPVKDRIKGGIKLGVATGLLAAGTGLTIGSIAFFAGTATLATLYGSTAPGSLGATYLTAYLVGGIFFAAGATVCIIIGVALLVQGIRHMELADEAQALRDDPRQRYAVAQRNRVHYGFRFGVPGAY